MGTGLRAHTKRYISLPCPCPLCYDPSLATANKGSYSLWYTDTHTHTGLSNESTKPQQPYSKQVTKNVFDGDILRCRCWKIKDISHSLALAGALWCIQRCRHKERVLRPCSDHIKHSSFQQSTDVQWRQTSSNNKRLINTLKNQTQRHRWGHLHNNQNLSHMLKGEKRLTHLPGKMELKHFSWFKNSRILRRKGRWDISTSSLDWKWVKY